MQFYILIGSVTREIRKERRRNFQQFIGCLPND